MILNTDEAPPVEILLVEDNPGDHRLTKEALHEGKVYNNLHWAKDGVEAIDFLKRRGAHANAPRPDIILLDLNLPKKDGREVLSEIKQDEDLRAIPVVILTSSREENDLAKGYQLGANAYVVKSSFDQSSLIEVIQKLTGTGYPQT